MSRVLLTAGSLCGAQWHQCTCCVLFGPSAEEGTGCKAPSKYTWAPWGRGGGARQVLAAGAHKSRGSGAEDGTRV